MKKKKNKILGRIVIGWLALFIVSAVIAVIGFLSLGEEFQDTHNNWWVIMAVAIPSYILLESYVIYYKEYLGGKIIDFADFICANGDILVASILLGLLFFIDTLIVGKMLGGLVRVAQDILTNQWVWLTVVVILAIVGVKYWIYKKFMEE